MKGTAGICTHLQPHENAVLTHPTPSLASPLLLVRSQARVLPRFPLYRLFGPAFPSPCAAFPRGSLSLHVVRQLAKFLEVNYPPLRRLPRSPRVRFVPALKYGLSFLPSRSSSLLRIRTRIDAV